MADTTKETLTGTVATSTFKSKSPKGWKTFEIVFTDGEAIKAAIPPDTNYEPVVGDELTFSEGRFNNWILNTNKVEGDAPKTGNKSSYKSKSGFMPQSVSDITDNNSYWRYKFVYDMQETNPRLDFQGHGNRVGGIYQSFVEGAYGAGVQLHELTDKQIEKFCRSIDTVVDRCYDKTKELYKRFSNAPLGDETKSSDEE